MTYNEMVGYYLASYPQHKKRKSFITDVVNVLRLHAPVKERATEVVYQMLGIGWLKWLILRWIVMSIVNWWFDQQLEGGMTACEINMWQRSGEPNHDYR
jgi:hypothetical protein